MGATQTRCAQTCVTLFPFFTAHHWPGFNADLNNLNRSLCIAFNERDCFDFSAHLDYSPKFAK